MRLGTHCGFRLCCCQLPGYTMRSELPLCCLAGHHGVSSPAHVAVFFFFSDLEPGSCVLIDDVQRLYKFWPDAPQPPGTHEQTIWSIFKARRDIRLVACASYAIDASEVDVNTPDVFDKVLDFTWIGLTPDELGTFCDSIIGQDGQRLESVLGAGSKKQVIEMVGDVCRFGQHDLFHLCLVRGVLEAVIPIVTPEAGRGHITGR